MNETLKVGLAQISPVWLNKAGTLDKILQCMSEAGTSGCDLVVFGEALLPGYPFWLALTGGAEWDKAVNKELHAHYMRNAVSIENGDLDAVRKLAADHEMAVYLGIIERPIDRGGHSIYASLVYIDSTGKISSVHRKLQPTYDERLSWSPGDGHGLQVHKLKAFTLGGLNCWENWMPLVRTALYGQGENVHIAVWPGSEHNTRDITRFIARESRSYVISVSSLMRRCDFPESTPHLDAILENAPEVLANGGSCIARPNGEWLIEPDTTTEGLITEELHFNSIYEERQNFDPVGHYSRPDVTKLILNKERQTSFEIEDGSELKS